MALNEVLEVTPNCVPFFFIKLTFGRFFKFFRLFPSFPFPRLE